MKFEDYAIAVTVPQSPTILGLELRPLSLGMYLNMRAYECAYASEVPTEVNILDLIKGVMICSCEKAETFPTFFNDHERFQKEVGNWSKEVSEMATKDKQFNIFDHMQAFKDYLDAGSKIPDVEAVRQDGTPDHNAQNHWSSNLHTFLLAKLNVGESRALNMPLVEAWFHYFQFMVSEGVYRFVKSPAERYADFCKSIEGLKK